MKKYTDHDIKEAVFYSQSKPELLIGIITDLLSSSGGETNSEVAEQVKTLEGKVTTLEKKVPEVEGKVTALEQKVNENHPS